MTVINFKANPVTSQKLATEKLQKLKLTHPEIAKTITESTKELKKNKTAINDLLHNIEEQIALEPLNIELRQAYEAIKSSL